MKVEFKCKDCGGTKFYNTGGQLHSDPPWDIFGCKECLSCWAINCRSIYSHAGDTVIYDDEASVIPEGKPFYFTDSEGRTHSLNSPPGISPRSEEHYAKYRSSKYDGPPAVGYYHDFDL